MRSPYPEPNLDADVEETRRVFVKYWTEQELYFPHPPDDTWKDHMRALHAECVDRAIVLHGHTAHDYDSWIEFALSLGEAYPDSETTYDAMAVEGDVGVALWTYRGTHLRPLRGHPPDREVDHRTWCARQPCGERKNRRIMGASRQARMAQAARGDRRLDRPVTARRQSRAAISGRRPSQGRARSSCPASWNSVCSSPYVPKNCMPIGKPASLW